MPLSPEIHWPQTVKVTVSIVGDDDVQGFIQNCFSL